jgi:hypothetical protein
VRAAGSCAYVCARSGADYCAGEADYGSCSFTCRGGVPRRITGRITGCLARRETGRESIPCRVARGCARAGVYAQ